MSDQRLSPGPDIGHAGTNPGDGTPVVFPRTWGGPLKVGVAVARLNEALVLLGEAQVEVARRLVAAESTADTLMNQTLGDLVTVRDRRPAGRPDFQTESLPAGLVTLS